MASASINDIKGRIKSVEGTMQITKAMELVATSKLRRAKERAESTKPYLETLMQALDYIGSTGIDRDYSFMNPDGKVLYIVIAGDRGLAGGYNNNIFKLAKLLDKDSSGVYLPIGKKAVEYFTRKGYEIFDKAPLSGDVSVGDSTVFANKIFASCLDGAFSSVKILYTKFVSMMTQTPVYEDILPLSEQGGTSVAEPLMEACAEEILNTVIPEYIRGVIYSAVCESIASECASRRTAMNSANKNAEEMIETLVLKFNRARQAVITQEITEIVSGAEAL